MLVRIITGTKTAICDVEEMRLTKNNKNAIIERLSFKEVEELDRNDINHEYVTNL